MSSHVDNALIQHGVAIDSLGQPDLDPITRLPKRSVDPSYEVTPGLADCTSGFKFDTEKPRFDLLLGDMPLALEALARVLTAGAQKYADGNWQYVENAERRYLAAGTRHELALAKGERHDPETGEHHLAHKLCCDLFRLELALRGSGQ